MGLSSGPKTVDSTLGVNGQNFVGGPLKEAAGPSAGPMPTRIDGSLSFNFPGLEISASSGPPCFVPPPGFRWKILEGVWAMVPGVATNEGSPTDLEHHDLGGTGSQSMVKESPSNSAESEDSVSVFERELRVLLPDLPCAAEEATAEQRIGTRRSERPKKPSSRFTEDAGFVAEPPKSTKKKMTPRGDTVEGTSNPLLLSDWSNAQIAKYCDACGIVFTDSVSDSIAHIRMLEQLRSASVQRPVASSLEGRDS